MVVGGIPGAEIEVYFPLKLLGKAGCPEFSARID